MAVTLTLDNEPLTVSRAPRYEVVDLFRGFAALGVFLLHARPFTGEAWLPQAYLALDFFFLISGFVIANGFDRRIAAGMPLREFFLLRLVRFYPAYFLALVVATPLMILFSLKRGIEFIPQDWLIAVGMELLMLPSVVDPMGTAKLYPINGICWSLFFEFFVNLIYFCIFPWLSKRGMQVLLAASAVLWLLTRDAASTIDVGYHWTTAAYALPRLLLPFFLGIYLRRYCLRRWQLPTLTWPVALGCVAAIALCFSHGLITAGKASFLGDVIAVWLVMPLVLLIAAQSSESKSLRSTSRYAGRISYPLYVLQDALFLLFAAGFSLLFKTSASAFAPWVIVPLLAISVALALLTDRYLEPWGSKHMKRWFGLAPSQPRIPEELLRELLAGPRRPLNTPTPGFYRQGSGPTPENSPRPT